MKHRSLRARFIPQLLLVLLALIAFITVYHLSVVATLRQRATQEGTHLCEIYVAEIDDVLSDVRRWLEVQFAGDTGLADLTGADLDARLAAQKRYTALLREAPSLYPAVTMAFVVSDEFPSLLNASSETLEYERYQELIEAARSVGGYGKAFDTGWTAVHAGESCVISTTLEVEGVLAGIFIEPETLLASMPFYDREDQHFVLAKHSGYIVMTTLPEDYGQGIDLTGDLSTYYVTGERGDVLVSGAPSQCGPFRLLMLTKDAEIMGGLIWTRWMSLALILISLGAIAGVMLSLKRQVLSPLDKATRAIRRFGQAQTGERLQIGREPREFVEIYQAFNDMAGQIEHLKIENYEQLIRKQQAELKFYQTQIKPHFILNCLTTIKNLALQGKGQALEQFITDFSGFARCMFRSDHAPVRVEEELKQVGYYIGMQSVRYPGRIFYLDEAGPQARDALMPAMLIETLVENSVKHGMDEEAQLSIFVRCALEEGLLTVTVEDSGPGFSGAALEAAGLGQSAGFGLRNLRATLDLLYGDRAQMRIENIPGSGARVTVTVPQA